MSTLTDRLELTIDPGDLHVSSRNPYVRGAIFTVAARLDDALDALAQQGVPADLAKQIVTVTTDRLMARYAHDERPYWDTSCPGCGGSGVRCCEFGADRVA